jgi:hypothetical protein
MNLFAQFQRLIGRQPLQVALVVTVNADGTSTVQSPAGNTWRVKGTSVSAGNRAFIRGDQIISAAPTLTVVQETI